MNRFIATEWVYERTCDDEDYVPWEAEVTIADHTISVYCPHTSHQTSISFEDFSYLLQHPTETINGASLTTELSYPDNFYSLVIGSFYIPLPDLQKLIKSMA
jgi:hypothetical protein